MLRIAALPGKLAIRAFLTMANMRLTSSTVSIAGTRWNAPTPAWHFNPISGWSRQGQASYGGNGASTCLSPGGSRRLCRDAGSCQALAHASLDLEPIAWPPASVPAVAVGAFALGALAIGALAIGALAIGRLEIRKARLREVDIDSLTVRHLNVTEPAA
jgi:hypothetical protein